MPKNRKILLFGTDFLMYFLHRFSVCKSLFIKDNSDFALA